MLLSDGVNPVSVYCITSRTGALPTWPAQTFGGSDTSILADPPNGGLPTPQEIEGGGDPSGKVCYQCTSHPVNTLTGSLFETFTDIAIPGRGPALSFVRTYDSTAASSDGPFGFGWTHSYNMSLNINGSTVTVIQENGSQIVFTLNGSTYSAPPREEATLVHNLNNNTYTFTRRARQIFQFSSTGQLSSEGDLNLYSTSLNYTAGQLTSITDPANRSLLLTYTGSHVTLLSDVAGGRTVSFQYNDGQGNLTDVYDVNNKHWHFAYDSSHRMTTEQTPNDVANGVNQTNHFDSNGRVDWQTDPLGQKTQFAYTSTTTTITDPKLNVTVDTYANGELVSETRGYGTSSAATWKYFYDPNTLGIVQMIDPNQNQKIASGNASPSDNFWEQTFDANGNLMSKSDPLGNLTQFTYDSLNDVQTVIDPNFVLNPSHPEYYTTTFTYDSNNTGNLIQTSTPLASSCSPQQQPHCSIVQTTQYGYNPSQAGDITSVTDPESNVWHYGYDTNGDLVSSTDPLSNTTNYCYDAIGRRTRMIKPNGTSTCSTTIPPAPNNFLPYVYQYSYDNMGRLLSSIDPLGHQIVNTYDSDENLKTAQDANGNLTTYNYDAADERTKIQRPDGTTLDDTARCAPNQQLYDGEGNRIAQIDGGCHITQYSYDPVGHLQCVTDSLQPTGRVTLYKFDGAGNEISKGDQASSCNASSAPLTTSYAYDVANRAKTITYSDGVTPNVSAIAYDADNQRTSMTDGWGTSTWTWDSLHRLTQSTAHPSGGATTTIGYGYDRRNLKTSIAYPGGNCGTPTLCVTYGYDAAGRLHTVTDWNNKTTTYTYDPDSFLTYQQYPNNILAHFTPDNADRLINITDNNSPVSFAYGTPSNPGRDANNQITSVTSNGVPSDNHSYSYTQLNQLGSQDSAQASYDSSDNPTVLTNGTRQGFDAANQLSNPAVTFVNSSTTAASGIATFSLPSGIQAGDEILVAVASTGAQAVATPTGYTLVGSFYSSDPATCWVGCTSTTTTIIGHQVGGGTASPSAGEIVLFQRTATGNGTDPSVTVGQNATSQEVVTIAAYRGVAALNPIDAASSTGTTLGTTATPPAINNESKEQFVTLQAAVGWVGSANWTAPQTPTPAMTERSQAADGQIVSGGIADKPATTPGSSGSLTSTFSQTSNLVDVSLALKSLQYTYDGRGNRTQTTPATSSAVNLMYDQANRLTGYGSNATYAYNGDGLRMSKTVSAVTTQQVWDVSGQIPLLIADGSTDYVYGVGGVPLEQISSSGTLYYHQDQLGSTRALSDSTGTIQATYTYDPYGNLTGSTGSISNPFGFAGQYTDAESGLVYLRARYYDPTTAQFLSRDPLSETTLSPYNYAANNPINERDPSGLFCGGPIFCPIVHATKNLYDDWSTGAHELYNDWSAGETAISNGSVGLCLHFDATFVGGGTLQGCIVLSQGSHLGFTGTVGAGVGSPNAGIGLGLQFSNASQASDLGGPFTYGSASAGIGPTINTGGFAGSTSCGKTIAGYDLGLGLGIGPPISGQVGRSETWTWGVF
ncbi:MAG: RHS repeat-associated core domain-containing protein [Actinomycetota bacterium]